MRAVIAAAVCQLRGCCVTTGRNSAVAGTFLFVYDGGTVHNPGKLLASIAINKGIVSQQEVRRALRQYERTRDASVSSPHGSRINRTV